MLGWGGVGNGDCGGDDDGGGGDGIGNGERGGEEEGGGGDFHRGGLGLGLELECVVLLFPEKFVSLFPEKN